MKQVSAKLIEKMLDDYNLKEVYVVCAYDLENSLKAEKVREGFHRVYLVRSGG
ncbi:MAG: hypothetical protein QW482_03430 [Thermoproteota archaeon]